MTRLRAAGSVEPPSAGCVEDESCITCGDVAVPLRVVEIEEGSGLALCGDDEGRAETVEIALVEPVAVGDTLLVHAGTAISRLGREAAGR